MPTIEVTDEQLDRLEAVRDDVAGTLAGPYGHVRVQDAVEYLLDTYTPPEERGETPAAAASESDAGAPVDGGLAALKPVGSAKAAALERAGYESVADLQAASVADLTEVTGIGETLAERILAAVDGDAAPTDDGASAESDDIDASDTSDEAETDDESGDDQADEGGNGGGAARLDAMMSLLDEHADKWTESDGDEPYEVELPDGSVETARTKDDVRGLLFRHY
ncbi:helix-hairpin-helix domain-containing protein [Halosegnis sp.]|uniref:helix-hairpin-helix domain-containing protein n=1 Tax=Halosegnis sp. TaxID=2864959 RepID=UPI0035D459C5